MNHLAVARTSVACCIGFASYACGGGEASGAGRTASLLHLADHLDAAEVECPGPPETAQETRRWSFAEERPEWKELSGEEYFMLAPLNLEQLPDGLRLGLTREGSSFRVGGVQTDLGELELADWETVVVTARTSDRFAGVSVIYNLDEEGAFPTPELFFSSADEAPPVFNDGSVQSYAIPLRAREGAGADALLRNISVLFAAPAPAEVDVLAVTLVPRGAAFLEPAGTRSVSRAGLTRHTLFAHAPATLTYPVELPAEGRLDFGLTVNGGDSITYKVSTERGGERELLFEETIEDARTWQQRSVDLSGAASSSSKLILEATSERPGAVAFWGAPILSMGREAERPNVIFYVIDGGDADFMSLYGFEHPTTPFLQELAKEGVVFERAFSNSTWTQPSTVSFMTSLHHSVLGGLRRGIHSTPVPNAATTMAEHFRAAGYQTASFTANPNAGRIVGTDRGVDVMRDIDTEHHSTSSVDLHDHFYDFRDAYPGGPYWVHFQTTDVHEPNHPQAPFAGRIVTAEASAKMEVWEPEIWESAMQDFGSTSVVGLYDRALERTGIDRQEYFGIRRDRYGETMMHQDHALEMLVEKLKKDGEWENTLLVIGSDHGHPAGTFARFGRGMLEPQPEPWEGAMCDAYATRVPLIVLWPGTIEGGRRIAEPVSMIDVLPTMLDLLGMPQPAIVQGQSLAPLLRGGEMELAPVILDEFRVDSETGEMIGNLEIIDGRWGASLEIGPVPEGTDPSQGRHAVPVGGRWGAVHPFFPDVPRLLLYDLEQDPFTLSAVNADHPELVERYTELLLEQWEAHRALSQHFGDADEIELSPDQLEQLRALGYIR